MSATFKTLSSKSCSAYILALWRHTTYSTVYNLIENQHQGFLFQNWLHFYDTSSMKTVAIISVQYCTVIQYCRYIIYMTLIRTGNSARLNSEPTAAAKLQTKVWQYTVVDTATLLELNPKDLIGNTGSPFFPLRSVSLLLCSPCCSIFELAAEVTWGLLYTLTGDQSILPNEFEHVRSEWD